MDFTRGLVSGIPFVLQRNHNGTWNVVIAGGRSIRDFTFADCVAWLQGLGSVSLERADFENELLENFSISLDLNPVNILSRRIYHAR